MSAQSLRITADELENRMSAGQQFTIIDARNPQAWAKASDKARAAIRVDMHANQPLPKLSHDRPVVIYCT